MAQRSSNDSPFELKKRLRGQAVTDHNAGVHGIVDATKVYANSCYVTVAFDDHRRLELEVIANDDERPLTPHFIRAGAASPVDWFRWRKPNDLLEHEEDPAGDITVTVTVRTPERAGPARQEQAAFYFAEVLAQGIDDVLDQELWPDRSAREQSGQVETRAKVERLTPPTVFGIEVRVWLFVNDETALDLLAKLYLLLDCKHARYPELWQDLFAARGVRDATPSAFFVTGRVAGRELDPATIPVRYYAPREIVTDAIVAEGNPGSWPS